MCGIYGQISNHVDNINSDKIKILGILNEERGTHSTGITIDADIYQGVDVNNRKFRDFAISADFTPLQLPIVFGHNRKSSVGAINVHNAHPFGFGENVVNKGYEFIGAHNGTVYNYEDLAETFEVAEKVMAEGTMRTKIDSEILLESIYKSKSYKPLSAYVGGAALIWYTPDNGKFYMFSGESKSYSTSTTTDIERPLHVWIVNDNTFYFSSEAMPLLVLGAKENEVFQIDTNTVYVIKDGDFKNAEKIKISRSNATSKKPYNNHHVGVHHNAYNRLPANQGGHASRSLFDEETAKEIAQRANETRKNREDGIEKEFGIQKPKGLVHTPTIIKATSVPISDIAAEDYRGRVYNRKMRYFRNGHPLRTGVYIYIPKHGFEYIGANQNEAIKWAEQNKYGYYDTVNQCLVNGVLSAKEKHSMRYTYLGSSLSINQELVYYYIVSGFIMRDYIDFVHYHNNPEIYFTKGTPNYHTLSHATRYPVFCETGADINMFLFDGHLTSNTQSISGPCFEYIYKIIDGRLNTISMIVRSHLAGLDLQNTMEYEEKVAAAEKIKKEAEEKAKREAVELSTTKTVEEATRSSVGFSTTIQSLKTYLISWKNVEPVCRVETIDLLEILTNRVELAFDEYEEDSINSKQDRISAVVFAQYCVDSAKVIGVTDFEEYIFDVTDELQRRRDALQRKNNPQDKPQIKKLTSIVELLFQN